MKKILVVIVVISAFRGCWSHAAGESLWRMACKNRNVLTVSTLFTAQNVRRYLTTSAGLDSALNLCRQTGITKVYLESFRGGYYAEKETLERAKSTFLKKGFKVSGCVTTTRLGKQGTGGWGNTPCYTNEESPAELQKIFEYTASLFDEIMVDDFLFTECTCDQCVKARGGRSWAQFRCDRMVELSRERILKPSRAVNPDVKIIIKYPLWYDHFQERGYDVIRQTHDYDIIWVGTETRDYDYDIRPSGDVQYNAYFLMCWMEGIGGKKLGGGWFDTLGTTPETYLEQARQTVLADAREIMLFNYSGLISPANKYNGWEGTGIADAEALRGELPGLFRLAEIVRGKSITGVHLPKPPNSMPVHEPYVFSRLGMLGIPLVPAYEFNEQAESAIFTEHVMKDPGFANKLRHLLSAGRPVVITDGLAQQLPDPEFAKMKNLKILEVKGAPNDLLKLPQSELKTIRDHLMAPYGLKFDAPNPTCGNFSRWKNNTFFN